jgi:hypothetical protein
MGHGEDLTKTRERRDIWGEYRVTCNQAIAWPALMHAKLNQGFSNEYNA